MLRSQLHSGNPRIFVVFGMPRTGTTYLYHALGNHPSIFVAYRKESHYFSANYEKGQAWFNSLYKGMPGDTLGADINPMYFLDDLSLGRILEYDRDVRIVLGVRQPVDFALSLYRNMKTHGLQVGSFAEVVQSFDWPLTPHSSLTFSLGNGLLRRRVTELREALGDNFLMYDFGAFNSNSLPVLQAIEQFLELPPHFDATNHDEARINASGRRNPLLLNRILTNQRVLESVYSVLPRSAIRLLRSGFERLSVRSRGSLEPNRLQVSEDEHRFVSSYLAEDTAFYEALFSEGPILRNNGPMLSRIRETVGTEVLQQ